MSKCPLLKYSEEEKREILKECGLKESLIEEDIEAIKEWFYKQPHLAEAGIDSDLIERLLIISKGSREKTKRRIDCLYRIKSLAPSIIQNREQLLDSKDTIWGWHRQACLPMLFEGSRISVLQITDPDPEKFFFDFMMKTTYMIGDVRLKHDYMKNDIWLADMKNTSFGHLPRLNPLLIQKAIQLFQDGFGLRVRGIHIFSAHPVVHTLLNLTKQFVLPKIFERIMFHDKIEDVHKYIPKKYLPKDFGGEQASIEELSDNWMKEMRSETTKAYLLDSSKRISNESLRPHGSIEDDPMAGSFKQLVLD